MKSLSRSTALKIAAALSFLMGAWGVVGTLVLLPQGAAAIDQSHSSPPYFILVLGLLMGVVAIVGAYGTWKQQRWGIILAIVANALNGLSAAPGILFAPQPWLFAVALLTVIVSIAIVVLCLWRDRRPALA